MVIMMASRKFSSSPPDRSRFLIRSLLVTMASAGCRKLHGDLTMKNGGVDGRVTRGCDEILVPSGNLT